MCLRPAVHPRRGVLLCSALCVRTVNAACAASYSRALTKRRQTKKNKKWNWNEQRKRKIQRIKSYRTICNRNGRGNSGTSCGLELVNWGKTSPFCISLSVDLKTQPWNVKTAFSLWPSDLLLQLLHRLMITKLKWQLRGVGKFVWCVKMQHRHNTKKAKMAAVHF